MIYIWHRLRRICPTTFEKEIIKGLRNISIGIMQDIFEGKKKKIKYEKKNIKGLSKISIGIMKDIFERKKKKIKGDTVYRLYQCVLPGICLIRHAQERKLNLKRSRRVLLRKNHRLYGHLASSKVIK